MIGNKNFWLSNAVYIVVAIAFLAYALVNPKFVSQKNLLSLLTQSCTVIIVGIGVALCMLTRGIDLSVGSIMYVSAVSMYTLLKANENLPIAVVILIGALIGLVIGLFNGFIVSVLKVYALLPTLATMFAFRGLGLSFAGASVSQMPMKWITLVSSNIGGIPLYVFVTFALAFLVQLLLNKTKIGRHIYAIGDNEKMAREKGIHVFGIKVLVYGVSGVMSALAGALSSAMTMQAAYTLGNAVEFKVITAAVLGGISLNGGRGTIMPGIIVGAIILTFISNTLVLMKANPYSYDIVYAFVIFAVVLLDTIKIRSGENNAA